MKAGVLVVDHNSDDGPRLTQQLAARGFEARLATDAIAATAIIHANRPGVVVAALDLPHVDGLELCRRIRDTAGTPVIVVSDDWDEDTEVAVLESGADDFIVRPLRIDSFVARLRVAFRRRGSVPDKAAVGVGPFNIDFNARRIHVNGQAVRLTPKEFDLFTFMARHPNRVLPHKTLLDAVWGGASSEQSEYLRVFVGQLRKKLEADPANPQYLVTEPWVGYRFNPGGLTQ